MLVTLDIDHPKINNYTQKEFETILKDYAYNYLDEEAENDTTIYAIEDEDLPENVKKAHDLFDKMTSEEKEKYFVDFSL